MFKNINNSNKLVRIYLKPNVKNYINRLNKASSNRDIIIIKCPHGNHNFSYCLIFFLTKDIVFCFILKSVILRFVVII